MTQTNHMHAALYFIGDQLLFEHRETGGKVVRKCISPQAAREAFLNVPLDSGWLSKHVIRWGHGYQGSWFMQRYEPELYTLDLKTPIEDPKNNAQLDQLHVHLPGFIFLGIDKTYFLWAYTAWANERTRLYHAPLPNIYDNGSICFGSLRRIVANGHTIDNAWELFWRSTFNTDLSTNRSRRHSDNVLKLLAELHHPENHQTPFPTKALRPLSLTMTNIIEQLNAPRRRFL